LESFDSINYSAGREGRALLHKKNPKNIQTQNFSILTKHTKLSMYLSYLPSFLKNREGDKVGF